MFSTVHKQSMYVANHCVQWLPYFTLITEKTLLKSQWAANHINILIIRRLSIPYSLQKARRFKTLQLISRNQYITGIDANTSK